MMMDFFQPGISRGMLLQMMASRNTVPPKMLRIVPLGDFHIFFSLNSICTSTLHMHMCIDTSVLIKILGSMLNVWIINRPLTSPLKIGLEIAKSPTVQNIFRPITKSPTVENIFRPITKSPTVENIFRPIPHLISCTGMTGRWGLLSYA